MDRDPQMPRSDQRGLEEQENRLEAYEAWWAFIARVLAFVLGAFGFGFEVAIDQGQRFYIVIGSLALMGPVVAQAAATMFASVRGGGEE